MTKKNSNIRDRRPGKVLLVTPRFPFPVIGGDKLRVYNIVKYLSRYYGFTLASLYSTDEEAAANDDSGVFEEIWRVRQPRAASYRHTAASIFSGGSLQSGYFYNPELKRLIDSKIGEYDLVIAHLIRASGYAIAKEIPSICEMTDAISMNYERASQTKGLSLRKLIYGFERKRCIASEKTCLDKFDASVVVSPNDRQYLADRWPEHSGKLRVIPNGVNVEDFACKRALETKGKIVFIGNMRTLQNSDAAVFFAKEVFPWIREKMKEASFWIIGADPGREVRSLSRIAGVVVTGRVEDVRATAHDAQVSVCPVRIGAGIQNKVLESMAMGLPVVTTTVGVEGINARNGVHLLVADGASEFSRGVLEMLCDRSKAKNLADSGRALVEERYSWESALSGYRELIESVLDKAAERGERLRPRRMSV